MGAQRQHKAGAEVVSILAFLSMWLVVLCVAKKNDKFAQHLAAMNVISL